MPKEEFFFTLEKFLKEQNRAIISNEVVKDVFVYLSVKNGDFYFENIKIASFNESKIFAFLFFNQLKIESILVDDSFKNMFPQKIDSIQLTHSIINPLNVIISANGEFGVANGILNLKDRTIRVEIIASDTLLKNRQILSKLKKEEDKLIYESSY